MARPLAGPRSLTQRCTTAVTGGNASDASRGLRGHGSSRAAVLQRRYSVTVAEFERQPAAASVRGGGRPRGVVAFADFVAVVAVSWRTGSAGARRALGVLLGLGAVRRRRRVLGDRHLAGLEPLDHDLDGRRDRDRQQRADEAAGRCSGRGR